MSTKRNVIMRGTPEVNEYGVAQEAIKPGYLVKGVSSVSRQDAAGTKVPVALALERREFGAGIDDTYQGFDTPSAFYASGDQIRVAVLDAGDEALVFVASGSTVNEDTLLGASNANPGRFITGATVPLVRSLENLGAIVVETAVKVQAI